MRNTLGETRLAATVPASGLPASAAPEGAPRSGSTSSGAPLAGTTSTTRRTLPPGALRADHEHSPARRRARLRPVVAAVAGTTVVLALAVAVWRSSIAPPPVTQEPVAVLELVRGTVAVTGAEASDEARLLTPGVGEPILAGMVIETGAGAPTGAETPRPAAPFAAAPEPQEATAATRSGVDSATRTAPGRVALRLAGGASVRLDHETRVRMATGSAMVLERGAVYVDAAARTSPVEIRTSLGVVRDIGTQFEVRLLPGTAGETLRVRVREGEVVLEEDGRSHSAVRGVELALSADGTLTRGNVAPFGAQWDWVLETAPVPEMGGRPLRAFLEWYVREGGWELELAGPAAEERAQAVLNGSFAGLSAEEALRLAFQGSGDLTYTLDAAAGTFRVEASPAPGGADPP